MSSKKSGPGTSGNSPAAPASLNHEQVLQQFKSLGDVCLSFDEFVAFRASQVPAQQQTDEPQTKVGYAATPGSMTPCGNGDFESGLDPTEWQGAFGPRTFTWPAPPVQPFSSLTAGIQTASGQISDIDAHHTWVSTQPDPLFGTALMTTAPGSAGAVRLGNAIGLNSIQGKSCELLSKTFVVEASRPYVCFWYAVVQRYCGHQNVAPVFWVRVTDAAGVEISQAVSLVGGSLGAGVGNHVELEKSHPFNTYALIDLPSAPGVQVPVCFKDWSCAQIDLTSQIGKQVTIEFVNADCWGSDSWGYTYIDKICSSCVGSPTGSFSYQCEASSHCGPGRVCFSYELPRRPDPATGAMRYGAVEITLQIYQNGLPVLQLSSGLLTGGRSHCFEMSATTLAGIDNTQPGFDFTASARFVFEQGGTQWPLGQQKLGIPGQGMAPGQNNDYLFHCKTCEEAYEEQSAHLARQCAGKRHSLAPFDCHCPPGSLADCDCGGGCGGCGGNDKGEATPRDGHDAGHEVITPAGEAATAGHAGCGCEQGGECRTVEWPNVQPCFSITWGDSDCDCLETNDVELLCLSACNCYDNVSFSKLVVHQIRVTDLDGEPVPLLPDGTPSVQVLPSGPIAFGALEACQGTGSAASCAQRELVLITRGAIGRNYKLSLDGVCFDVTRHAQCSACFVLPLCQD